MMTSIKKITFLFLIASAFTILPCACEKEDPFSLPVVDDVCSVMDDEFFKLHCLIFLI